MRSTKPTVGKASHSAAKPTRRALIRAIASSTTIETGQSISQIERKLRGSKTGKYCRVPLAR